MDRVLGHRVHTIYSKTKENFVEMNFRIHGQIFENWPVRAKTIFKNHFPFFRLCL
jgi:hypothetical protein